MTLNSWELLRLGDCIQFISGGTPSKSKPEYWNGDIPWVSCKDMKVPRLYDAEDHITQIGAQNGTRLVKSGTILIVVRGMILAQQFPVALTMRPLAFNQDLKALRHSSHIDTQFLFYWLRSNEYKILGIADEAAHGTKRLQSDRLNNLQMLLPPLPTQRRIAAVLSAYDDLIENNQRRIAILEEMAHNLYREWFVHLRFPGHEGVEIVERDGMRVPEGWEVTSLGNIAKEVRHSINPESINPDTPYVGLEHIPRKSITLSEWGEAKDVQSIKLIFQKGNILFGKIRPYFHKVSIAPINGVCSSDTIIITPREDKYFSIIIACVSSDAFVEQATQTSQGTKMPRANWDVLTQYQILLPPSDILNQFNEFIENIVMKTQNLMFCNRKLRETHNILLPKLISGDLNLSDHQIATSHLDENLILSDT